MEVLKATLIKNISEERFRTIDGGTPEINDLIALDQGFTFPNGEPGCLVYGLDQDGNYRYEAEVYETEISERNISEQIQP